MEALSLSSYSNYKHGGPFFKPKKSMLYRQIANHALKSSRVSSHVLTLTSSLSSPDNGPALVEDGSSVLSPNGEDFVSTGAQSTSVVEMDHDGIGIIKFLRGETFLITGGTGFLGKVLIEKILWTAPDVHKIFVLIKAKNKEAAVDRLKKEIIYAEIFKRLKQIHGKSYEAFMMSKLAPVVGNLCESNLGLDEDAANLIAKEVDIIVNSAANTTFDERYDTALELNTGGPTRIMGFAKQCQKLKLFLQVSTAYVNGQRRGRIMEKPFYLGESIRGEMVLDEKQQESFPKLSVDDEMKLVSESKHALEDNSLLQKMKELGKRRANTFGWQDVYAFTKAMGEMMIESLRGDIPVVVIRPSAVHSTYREPFPGWIQGNRLMDPVIQHYGKGHLTGFLVDLNEVLDIIPADMVVNATLAAMAKHGATGKPESNIYQVASSVVNPLSFRDLTKLIFEHFNSSPFIDSTTGTPIRVAPMEAFSSMEDFSSNLRRHAINRTGIGAGAALANLDQKFMSLKLETRSRKIVEQVKRLANIYEPYAFYGGRFDNSNTKILMGFMSEEERQQFDFDVESIDWKDYINNVHIPGLRRHVMKHRGPSG